MKGQFLLSVKNNENEIRILFATICLVFAYFKMVLDFYILLIAEALSKKIKQLENLHIQNLFCKKACLYTIHVTLILNYCVIKITNETSWMKLLESAAKFKLDITFNPCHVM